MAGKPTNSSKKRPAGKAAVTPHIMQTRPAETIRIGERHRKDKGDIAGLAASIDARGGLLQPVCITPKNTLIDGERRILAWAQSKFAGEPIPVHVVDVDAIARGEWDANTHRKGFTPSESVALKRALEPKLKADAKERQGARHDIRGNSPNVGVQHPGDIPQSVAADRGERRSLFDRGPVVIGEPSPEWRNAFVQAAADGEAAGPPAAQGAPEPVKRQPDHLAGQQSQDPAANPTRSSGTAREAPVKADKAGALPAAPNGRAADVVAKIVGKDRRTIEKAEKIVAAAEAEPEKFGKLVADMDKTGRVDGPYKRLQTMQAAERIRTSPPALPVGRWGGIVGDPPWAAEPEDDDPKRLARGYYPYPTMSIAQIAALPVADMAADDCVLALWITNFHLVRGHHLPVLQAWGFEPVTIRTWVKDRMGRGQVLRGQTEHCIIATRGKPVIDLTNQTTFFHAAAGQHSEKPKKSYDDFERLVPAPRYLELFARRTLPANWDGYGNEVGSRPAQEPAPTGAVQRNGSSAHGFLNARSPSKRGVNASAESSSMAGPQAEAIHASRFLCRHAEREGHAEAEAAPQGSASAAFPEASRKLLAALQAIDAGDRIDCADNSLDGLVTGNAKQRLTKAGRARMETLAEEAALADALAALPDDIDALIAEYRATLTHRHAAAMANEEATAEALGERLRHLLMKANGGTDFGMACDDSPAEQLRLAARAPIGEVPMWGQKGLFRLWIDGVPYLVEHEDLHHGLAIYAEDPAKPFLSESGYRSFRSFVSDGIAYGVSVAEQAAAYIREEIASPSDRVTGGRRPRKQGLPMPARVYRLPASWEESDEPIDASATQESEPGNDEAHDTIPAFLKRSAGRSAAEAQS